MCPQKAAFSYSPHSQLDGKEHSILCTVFQRAGECRDCAPRLSLLLAGIWNLDGDGEKKGIFLGARELVRRKGACGHRWWGSWQPNRRRKVEGARRGGRVEVGVGGPGEQS